MRLIGLNPLDLEWQGVVDPTKIESYAFQREAPGCAVLVFSSLGILIGSAFFTGSFVSLFIVYCISASVMSCELWGATW